jgi:putative ABC transport system ATP-binding protein
VKHNLHDQHLNSQLPELLRELCDQLEVVVNAETIDRVANESQGRDWSEVLDLAAVGVGLRLRWSRLTPWEAGRISDDFAPWILSEPDGWWIIDGARPTSVRVRRIDSVEGARWMNARELEALFGAAIRRIARAEPALPASAMGPRADGRPRPPIRRLLGLLNAERHSIGMVVVFSFTIGILALAPPLAIQVIINWLAFGVLLQPIIAVAFILILCMLAAATLRASQRHLVELIQRRLLVRAVADITTRLIRVRISALDRHYGPELVNRYFDVLTLQKATSALLLDGLSAALQAFVGLTLLALYHPVLLAFDVAVICLLLLLIPLGYGAQKTAIKESKAKYRIASWIEEIARHPHVFKLGGGDLGESRTETLLRGYISSRQRHFQVFFRQYVGLQLIQVAIPSVLLLLCGWLVLEGQLTLGQLVAAEFIVTSALAGMSKFTDKLETVYDLLAGVDKLGTLMDLPHEPMTGLAGSSATQPTGLRLQGVRYSYTDHPALPWTLEAEIPPGARVLITGDAGAGKTTLAELLVGLRSPSSGVLLRDGTPMSLLRPDVVHGAVALVTEDGMFDGTIRDNLLVGRSGLNFSNVWPVLEMLSMDRIIGALPHGLDTRLAPTGAPLSRMHARVLLLARALLGSPRLLVIDGLLDGLPEVISDQLMSALHSQPNTTIVVLSTDLPPASFATHTFALTADGLHANA